MGAARRACRVQGGCCCTMAFLFGEPCILDLQLNEDCVRRTLELKKGSELQRLPLFYGRDNITGKVNLRLKGKKFEHNGIKIELLGQIEMFYDRGNHYEFTSVVRELAPAGEITSDQVFDFEFLDVEKQHESYNGINVRLRYCLRCTVNVKRSLTNVVKEQDFWVHNFQVEPEINNSIKMEVGIEDCLHIEFEYNRSKYHLKDVIVGKIYFLLVRIKIKHMELAIIKRESTGSGQNTYTETDTVTKYEIMDGAPVRGESIPIRLFLAGYELTPSMRDVNKKFSVRYFLNLVLIDEEDRRYFKQQEIVLWRKLQAQTANMRAIDATKKL